MRPGGPGHSQKTGFQFLLTVVAGSFDDSLSPRALLTQLYKVLGSFEDSMGRRGHRGMSLYWFNKTKQLTAAGGGPGGSAHVSWSI